jgi:C-terminal processing protease CtpA/Prc
MLASIWAPKKVNSSGVGYATFRCAAPFIRDRRRPKASWSQAIEADGPAAENGFQTGDVILNVGGKAVSNTADLREAPTEARAKRSTTSSCERGQEMRQSSSRFRAATHRQGRAL